MHTKLWKKGGEQLHFFFLLLFNVHVISMRFYFIEVFLFGAAPLSISV